MVLQTGRNAITLYKFNEDTSATSYSPALGRANDQLAMAIKDDTLYICSITARWTVINTRATDAESTTGFTQALVEHHISVPDQSDEYTLGAVFVDGILLVSAYIRREDDGREYVLFKIDVSGTNPVIQSITGFPEGMTPGGNLAYDGYSLWTVNDTTMYRLSPVDLTLQKTFTNIDIVVDDETETGALTFWDNRMWVAYNSKLNAIKLVADITQTIRENASKTYIIYPQIDSVRTYVDKALNATTALDSDNVNPVGITVTDTMILVVDNTRDRVFFYDHDFNVLSQFINLALSNNRDPNAIAVRANTILIANNAGKRIHIYTNNSGFTQVGICYTEHSIRGMDADAGGVYTVDSGTTIRRYDRVNDILFGIDKAAGDSPNVRLPNASWPLAAANSSPRGLVLHRGRICIIDSSGMVFVYRQTDGVHLESEDYTVPTGAQGIAILDGGGGLRVGTGNLQFKKAAIKQQLLSDGITLKDTIHKNFERVIPQPVRIGTDLSTHRMMEIGQSLALTDDLRGFKYPVLNESLSFSTTLNKMESRGIGTAQDTEVLLSSSNTIHRYDIDMILRGQYDLGALLTADGKTFSGTIFGLAYGNGSVFILNRAGGGDKVYITRDFVSFREIRPGLSNYTGIAYYDGDIYLQRAAQPTIIYHVADNDQPVSRFQVTVPSVISGRGMCYDRWGDKFLIVSERFRGGGINLPGTVYEFDTSWNLLGQWDLSRNNTSPRGITATFMGLIINDTNQVVYYYRRDGKYFRFIRKRDDITAIQGITTVDTDGGALLMIGSTTARTREELITDGLTIRANPFKRIIDTLSDTVLFRSRTRLSLDRAITQGLTLGSTIAYKFRVFRTLQNGLRIKDKLNSGIGLTIRDGLIIGGRSFAQIGGQIVDRLYIGVRLNSHTAHTIPQTLRIGSKTTKSSKETISDGLTFRTALRGGLAGTLSDTLYIGTSLTKHLDHLITQSVRIGTKVTKSTKETISEGLTIRTALKGGLEGILSDRLYIKTDLTTFMEHRITQTLRLKAAPRAIPSIRILGSLTLSDSVRDQFNTTLRDTVRISTTLSSHAEQFIAQTLLLISKVPDAVINREHIIRDTLTFKDRVSIPSVQIPPPVFEMANKVKKVFNI